MEEHYKTELLKDISKAPTVNEKCDLMMILIKDLIQENEEHQSKIENLTEQLTSVAAAAGSIANDVIHFYDQFKEVNKRTVWSVEKIAASFDNDVDIQNTLNDLLEWQVKQINSFSALHTLVYDHIYK